MVVHGINPQSKILLTENKKGRYSMRAIIEIFLAIIFTIIFGATGVTLTSTSVEKESIKKVSEGLGSLEIFTKKMTGH
jgi:hypothetical protein